MSMKDRIKKKLFGNYPGRVVLDRTPLAVPIGFEKPESLESKIVRLMRSREFNRAMDARGLESFEDSEDFEVPDEFDDEHPPESPYDTEVDPFTGKELYKSEKKLLDKARAAFDAGIEAKKKHILRSKAKNVSPKAEPKPLPEEAET